jgi:hypothetical protein
MQHRSIMAGLVLAAVLAGCTAPAPTPTEPPASTQAATPTPTAVADPGPVVRVDATCGDFADAATLSDLMAGADMQLVTEPAGSLGVYSEQQHGSLECWWAPGGSESSSQRIQISVVPDVTSFGEVEALVTGDPGVVAGGYHGDAYSNCRAHPNGRSCRLSALIDGWYLEVLMHSTQKAAEGVSRKWGDPLLQRAADLVAALPAPAAAWQAADPQPAPGDYWRPLVADGSLADDLGYPSVDVAFVAPTPQDAPEWFSARATGYEVAYLQAISGTDVQNFEVQWLPGGSWAWGAASAGGTPLTGVGDEAVALTSDGNAIVVFRVGDDLASTLARGDGSPAGTDLKAVATIAAQHVAALLG